MGMHFVHHHSWGVDGKCRKCPAKRCGATVVQFRRGRPLEMRCKAAVGKIPNLCDRCSKAEAKPMYHNQPEPDPVASEDAGDFFRAVLLDHLVQCSEPDCEQETRSAVETRDAARLPYCHAHMHVVFADWMVGV